MASVTVKALPASLHRALKSRAKRHKRSLNQEMIAVLEQVIATPQELDVEKLIKKDEEFRSKLKFTVEPAEIDHLKRAGRR